MTAYTLSGREAGAIATRVRLLRRQRLLTAHQAALADVMLWSARRPGSGLLTASLAVLARLAGQARSTVAEGIDALERIGILTRIRRRIRIAWIAGATASRQVANSYVLKAPDTGSAGRSASKQPLIISVVEAPITALRAAQEALKEVARRRTAVIGLAGG